jgi:hypothetical protein
MREFPALTRLPRESALGRSPSAKLRRAEVEKAIEHQRAALDATLLGLQDKARMAAYEHRARRPRS